MNLVWFMNAMVMLILGINTFNWFFGFQSQPLIFLNLIVILLSSVLMFKSPSALKKK